MLWLLPVGGASRNGLRRACAVGHVPLLLALCGSRAEQRSCPECASALGYQTNVSQEIKRSHGSRIGSCGLFASS